MFGMEDCKEADNIPNLSECVNITELQLSACCKGATQFPEWVGNLVKLVTSQT
jgi:hypothetical protein